MEYAGLSSTFAKISASVTNKITSWAVRQFSRVRMFIETLMAIQARANSESTLLVLKLRRFHKYQRRMDEALASITSGLDEA